MPFAVCRFSVVPVRLSPEHISEMSSSVRGGEAVEILEEAPEWWRVRMADDYEGWVSRRQFGAPQEARPAPAAVWTDELCGTAAREGVRIALPLGAPLPDFKDGRFRLGAEWWEWKGAVRTVPAGPPDKAAVIAYAMRHLGAPYQWGGRTVFGVDCSGFVQSVLAAFGVRLPRDSKQQALAGAPVASRAEAVPCDLAFFGSQEHGVHHVGMLLPCGEIIHASGHVHVDDMTDEGIRSRETGELTHQTLAVRRVL
jgi:cell wall-associated NlpC family hydrolase